MTGLGAATMSRMLPWKPATAAAGRPSQTGRPAPPSKMAGLAGRPAKGLAGKPLYNPRKAVLYFSAPVRPEASGKEKRRVFERAEGR